MGYIYKITNMITNCVYVGKTVKDIQQRFNEHIRNGRKIHGSSKISKSLREYGSLNHKIEILEICNNNVILEREQFWIDELNTLHIGLNIKNEKVCKEYEYWGNPEKALQNIASNDVWNKGISPSKKTRKKISETKKKRYELGLYENYGHTHTEETKKKLSEIAKNRESTSDNTKNKIGESSKGRKFYYNINDKKRIFVKSNEPVPSGYVQGKGMVWVSKNGKNQYIDIWDLQDYLNKGYVEGRVYV